MARWVTGTRIFRSADSARFPMAGLPEFRMFASGISDFASFFSSVMCASEKASAFGKHFKNADDSCAPRKGTAASERIPFPCKLLHSRADR